MTGLTGCRHGLGPRAKPFGRYRDCTRHRRDASKDSGINDKLVCAHDNFALRLAAAKKCLPRRNPGSHWTKLGRCGIHQDCAQRRCGRRDSVTIRYTPDPVPIPDR